MKTPNPRSVRELIDQYFSLQWCRENVVAPLRIIQTPDTEDDCLLIAIGNYAYLGTIGDFIKKRLADAGSSSQFIEKPPEVIQRLIDEASEQKLITDESQSLQFNKESILDVLRDTDAADSANEYDYDFDDSDEQIINEEMHDLENEILGTKIQQAAAKILINSARLGVSDIHIEPKQEEYKVRVRRDGVMQSYVSMPRTAGIKLTACLKNMAQMDIAERRASQDGKIRRTFEGSRMEFRCATVQGKYGEMLVMRFLNCDENMLNLDLLVTDHHCLETLRYFTNLFHGFIIFTGPTGSGKSTTIASALRELDSGEQKIVTAEDPIEYDLGGNIQQFPVLRAKGQTFVKLLRIFLRQDPDIILIGETRNPETAQSCLDAAETGHLVFTTMHQNSASDCITTLMEMEVPSYKINSGLRGVVAQRLVRKVCPKCSSERPINEVESDFTGLPVGTPVRFAAALNAEEKQQSREEGTLCSCCEGTGYRGRVAAYEVLPITPKIRSFISQKKTSMEIQDAAVDEGMITLRNYIVNLISNQMTTISELQKILDDQFSY